MRLHSIQTWLNDKETSTMMKTVKGAATAVIEAPQRAAAWLMASAMTMSTTGLAAADTANVRGALDQNQDGLEAVADSSFTGDGAKESASNVTDVVMYAAGAIGIVLVLVGIYQLWKHQKEGDQARGSAAAPVAMILIGGLFTIPAIMTAVAPQIFVGTDS